MNDFDFHDAIIQIEMLFQSHIISYGYKEYSLETFADRGYFQKWKANEGCRDTDEMRASIDLDGILKSDELSEGEVLTYLQYVLNIAELCRRSFNKEDLSGYDFDIRNYTELISRIRAVLKDLKYDVQYVPDKEFLFLVKHDPLAEAVSAEEQSPLTGAITEYRALPAAAGTAKKRELLKTLGAEIESYPDNLRADHAALYSRIEFLLNNISIRYDNTEGEERIDRVSEMEPSELEEWYDEAFHLLLLRIFEHQSEERLLKVDALARECGTEIHTVTEDEIEEILRDFHEEEARTKALEKERAERSVETAETSADGLAQTGGAAADTRDRGRHNETSVGTSDSHKSYAGMRTLLAVLIAVALFVIFLVIYYAFLGG